MSTPPEMASVFVVKQAWRDGGQSGAVSMAASSPLAALYDVVTPTNVAWRDVTARPNNPF